MINVTRVLDLAEEYMLQQHVAAAGSQGIPIAEVPKKPLVTAEKR
jgi:hypothetical protein